MKDENNGTIITEFVGLRAKMYTLDVDGKKYTMKTKITFIARSITFDDYMQCLNNEIEMKRRQSCVTSNLHEVYTILETKIASSSSDTLCQILQTLPWEYYKILPYNKRKEK